MSSRNAALTMSLSRWERGLVFVAVAAAINIVFVGCGGCGVETGDEDAGVDAGFFIDAGTHHDGGVDAGSKDAGTPVDAGPPFKTGFADDPCPDASYDFEQPDGGFPDGTVIRGLCIGLKQLTGVATLDGAPVTAPIHLIFDSTQFRSEIDRPADPTGHYVTRVMHTKYDRLLYKPNEILNYLGAKDFGAIDMRKDQSRDVSMKTWIVAGAAFFAGQPWPSSVNPPDTTVIAEGLPPQSAWTANISGSYSVRLAEGEFAYKVTVPFNALGETELMKYPVLPWLTLNEDKTVDIDLPTSELSGDFTIDGNAFPKRIQNGPDYRLEYTPIGAGEATVGTVHEGGGSFFSAIVPKNTYSVNLQIFAAPDPHLPSELYNYELSPGLDLSKNQQRTFNLDTWKVEGALMIDGVPVVPQPGKTWTLYAYAASTAAQPWFLAYYDVPFTSPSFSLRALPGEYYVALYLDSTLHPDFPEGWYEVNPDLLVNEDVSLPIDIPTETLGGTLSLDGVPAANANISVGTLWFESLTGYYRVRLRTTDGTFHVRLPKGVYDISFTPNGDAYPDYAVGRAALGVTVDLTKGPQTTALDYRTIPVAGPLRIANEEIPDALGLMPEASLTLQATAGFISFHKDLQGGQPWYFLRVPLNDYQLSFEIKKDVYDGVAWGTAPLGNNLILRK